VCILLQEAADAAAKQAEAEDELDADLMAGMEASEAEPVIPAATRRAVKKSARAIEAEMNKAHEVEDSG